MTVFASISHYNSIHSGELEVSVAEWADGRVILSSRGEEKEVRVAELKRERAGESEFRLETAERIWQVKAVRTENSVLVSPCSVSQKPEKLGLVFNRIN